jgi:hypothetical protein
MATTTFNDLITFSRGSNATVTGPNGLIQWAPANLLTNSQDFEAAAWNKSSSTITANNATAPDGTQTADTFTDDATNARHGVNQNPTIVASTDSTFSVYVKKGTGRYFTLAVSRAAAGGTYFAAIFDLDTATITATNAVTATYTSGSITAVGNGWYRCSITGFLSTFTDAVALFSSASAATGFGDRGAQIYVGSGSTYFIWGAQVELGSTATTYNNTSVRNLLGFSEAFDNAAWTKTRASIVTGAQANPVNGLFNAQKLMEDTTASNTHVVSQSVTFAAIPYTFSVYAKAAERSWLYLNLPGTTNAFASFNVSTGVVGTVGAAATASIRSVGSGWYICTLIATATAGANTVRLNLASADNTIAYTGDGNSGVYIYGAMLSNSASLDPYVPTPGAAPSSTAYYGPRFDYDPVTLLPRGLLVEEARTNLLTYSEQFDNAAWTKTAATITANATVSPDGATTADKIVEDATNNWHGARQVAGSGTVGIFSFYAKAAERSRLWVAGDTPDFVAATAVFNISNGTVQSGTGTITAVGNGWYRCSISTTVSARGCTIALATDAGTAIRVGDGTSGAFVWGAQLEAGAFATSYIPTIASTVTRSADVATITGSLFSQWYRQDEGSFIADAVYAVAVNLGDRFTTQTDDGTANNRILTTVDVAAVDVGGVRQATLDGGTPLDGASNKLAFAYKANDFAVSLNSAAVVTDTSGTLPTVNRLTIGSRTGGASYFNGWLRSIRYVPVRAADFQLQQVTT